MRIGSLCSGYGGLELGVQAVYGGTTAWVSDIDKGACKILAHRFPDVPNIGDMTAIDWSAVEPVDLICGGTPCQDLSHAGKRAGMTEGSRSNLWVAMREAIAQLRPSLVIWENVRGAYSAEASSALVDDARLLADTRRRDGEPVLRALGRVLGDLSDLGYDASWHGLRAADVGAPHGRFRVFVIAGDARRIGGHEALEHDGRGTASGDWRGVPDESDRDALRTGPVGELLPTPSCSDTNGAGAHGDGGLDLRTAVSLLPTPAVNDMGDRPWANPETWDAWVEKHKAAGINGNGHGKSLAIEAQRLLPTPNARDWKGSQASSPEQWEQMKDDWERPGGPSGLGNLPTAVTTMSTESQWGDYASAIARWEHALGRPAPAPTMTSAKGNPQLSPAFVEWMMGLPAGWVTDVPGITRNEALRALGNGVVPQQAAEALRVMASWEAAA